MNRLEAWYKCEVMTAWTTVVAITMGRKGVDVEEIVTEASKHLHSVRRSESLCPWGRERGDNKKADSFCSYAWGGYSKK